MALNYRIAEEMGEDWCPELPGELLGFRNAWAASNEWMRWIRRTFIDIDPEGRIDDRLVNEEHKHLRFATLGVLLTGAENTKQGRRVVGTAQMPKPKPGWSGALTEWHQRRFFGHIPTFIITLDANYMLDCSPGSLCALVEHELYHCGQAFTQFGEMRIPRFSKATGKPMFAVRPHDVQEFIGIGRRYGSLKAASGTRDLVEACNEDPLFDDVDITTIACGTAGCNH